jgi:uncharacterized repeat protein (TIGR01451 family)
MKKQLRQYAQRVNSKIKALSPQTRMRVRGGVAILALVVIGVYATTQIFGHANDVTGIVFHDYNGNGKQDNALAANPSLAADRGLAGITVRGFGTDGALCDTKTSDANGNYTLSMGNCVGGKYRVEFSTLPAGYSSSQVGADSKTTTQFVAAGGVASLGAFSSLDYCQNNPKLVTSCIKAGPYNGTESTANTILSFLYGASGTTTPPIKLGTHGQVGATYGQAYRPSTGTVYSSAFMRRHDGFGPAGPGAIYISQVPASGSGTAIPRLAVTIPNSGTDSHPVSDSNCNSQDGQSSSAHSNCWEHDQFSFDSATKRSLGQMTLVQNPTNPSGDALLVVNLNDRQLYKVSNLNATPATAGFPLPLSLPNNGTGALPSGTATGQHQGCTPNDVRPFSVTVHNGTGYAGFVCSAQTSRSASDLRAYVYTFNPTTLSFATSPMMEFPLNYGRSCAYGSSSNCSERATWIPWISDFTDPLISSNGASSEDPGKPMSAPQPILSDITFGDNGSMTIGLRDRYDDQMSYLAQSTNPNSSQRYTPKTAGDILRACLVDNSYVLESSGKCDGKGPGSDGAHAVASGLPQGIGGSEFYSNEFYANTNGSVLTHDEVSDGALAQIPGFDSFANTSINPLDGTSLGNVSGGIREYNSESGVRTNSYRLYQNPADGNYLKGSALGDVDFVCDTAPVEIGNRVWKDTNANGVQDSAEPGIAGVTVTLRNSSNTVIATAITDADGNYLFSTRTQDENGQTMVSTADKRYAVAGLTANTTNYKLTLSTPADYTDPARLQSMHLTTLNSTANFGDTQNDSNAVVADPANKLSATNPATITFATGAPGANDHTLDFGFDQTVSIGNFVWLDANKDGKVGGSEATLGINGVLVTLYASSADTDNNGSLSASELLASTPIASQHTGNDARPGATNGRPGYYQFDGLSPGDYFVAVGGENFGDGHALHALTDVPVPSGVGDTQDDNTNHGSIPAGVVSTKISLHTGTEPTSTSAKPDDDASNDSDTTIDFGFWHSYSLGNRVWLDDNNSATIDAGDGTTPGIKGVTVRLLNSAGTTEVDTTTTDNGGYYRFDNLNAGTYVVEVAASNFATGGPLHSHNVSSVGAGEEIDPDSDGDSNDNGINPTHVGDAVRSGTITLGPGATEPTGETDTGAGGQGNDDAFANMTLDFGFIGSTSFGDTVYYDLNGNATQDTNEPGIPNVTVTLVCGGADGNLATTGDNMTQTQKTDGNGNYLFTGLLPQTCKATVTTSDVPGATLTTPGQFTHTIIGETSFLDADFGFKGTGSIGNQVWKEVFADGTYSLAAGDMPVPGVKIELYRDLDGNGKVDNSDVLIGTQTTDADGRYQFTNLPVDDNISTNGAGAQYAVKLTDPDNKLKDLQLSTGPLPGADNNSQTPDGYGMTLTLAAQSNQTGDFGYHGLATVGDTVYYDANNSGTQEPTETLLPGIQVTLTYPGPDGDCKTAADNATQSMTTDANGNYLFTNLLGGKYCISIQPPTGTTITTGNQGEEFTLAPTQIDLTRDFGVIGNGTIGNQVFVDYNNNGRYDTGDTGVEGVTIDLYRDFNNNGTVDAGEPVIKTTTTDNKGQYGFDHLVTGDAAGVPYIVVVTDMAKKLTTLTYVPGDGSNNDNESKPPTGYVVSLTPTIPDRPDADFGYKPNPEVITPPKFWKQQVVDNNTTLEYTLTWINLSSVKNVNTNFFDGIPDQTAYIADSLKCTAKGISVTATCIYNPALNRIEWSGTVGPDLGHPTPDTAVNAISVTYKIGLNSTALEVDNQGFGTYTATPVPNVPTDWIDTPKLNDPTIYVRTPIQAAITNATGGILANTGQVVVASVVAAGVIIVFSVAYVVISRRRTSYK